MYFYLTANEFYSGIYQGQVIDLVDFLKEELNFKIRLVVFLPIKGFFKRRKEIKLKSPLALVVPMTPKQSSGTRWKQNRFQLFIICRLYNCKGIIARGPFASWLAISARKRKDGMKVCYDGRGALAAEEKEYKIFPSSIAIDVHEIERQAIMLSDFRICITESLLNYWKSEYHYKNKNHFIIPGTLNKNFINFEINEHIKNENRIRLGYNEKDIILIYAGSTEGWQSFDLLYQFLVSQFNRNADVKVLFLSKEEENILKLAEEFPDRVSRLWLQPSEVRDVMVIGDYGLIIREKSITNFVAMPTKFPEYLACGLNVITNDAVDDVTNFVFKHGCGFVIENDFDGVLKLNTMAIINKNRELGLRYYNKYAHELKAKYISLVQNLK